MKSQLLYLIRLEVIKGRRHVQDQKGRPVYIKSLGIKGRLLVHPSTPFHYVAVKAVASGAWRSQKTEIVKTGEDQVWKCTIDEMIHRRVPLAWREELVRFLSHLEREETDQVWRDTDFTFPRSGPSDWFFVYNSTGTFDHYQGEGKAFRRGVHVYTGLCQGTMT